MPRVAADNSGASWIGYYRWTAKRPPRELLLQTLKHVEWEGTRGRNRTAIDLGFGSGTDTLELLRQGWNVVAVDAQATAARFLTRRVPSNQQKRLTCFVTPMEDFDFPDADLIYASFSLPFCPPDRFAGLWTRIRAAVRPGGHIAGQLFGDEDEWYGHRPMNFHSPRQIRNLARGFRVELLREAVEEGMSYGGPKHWHYYDLILGNPPQTRHRLD